MTNRQPAGVPAGGQFAAESQARPAVTLDDALAAAVQHGEDALAQLEPNQAVAPVHPDIPEGTPEGRFQYLVAMEPDVDEAVLREVFAPEKVAANAGRIYDYMSENGIGADSATREGAFAYAASALDRPYDDFYDAWIDEKPVDLGDAEQQSEPEPTRKITDLTNRESATLRKMPLRQLMAVTEKLEQGPADGFRATGPEDRMMIVSQIGDSAFGNIAAISGHRVVPLPDGIELPVAHGIKVRVRLAANDTYTVQRVKVRGTGEKILGEREGVYADSLSNVAYRAGMYESYADAEEW